MIVRLHIKNFKSLEDFWFPSKEGSLAPLTVLVGLNGSGKSTVLQAFDFLGQLVGGNVAEWLESRDWKAEELRTSFTSGGPRTIQFSLVWKDPEHGEISWWGRYNPSTKRCTQEVVSIGTSAPNLLSVNSQKYSATDGNLEPEFRNEEIPFEYEGSILSSLKLDKLHPALKSLKSGLEELKSLELLSPHLMRKRAKAAEDVGLGGEKLSAFLSTLDEKQIDGLIGRLKCFYPHLQSIQIKSLRAGWKELRVKEKYHVTSEFGATQLNDGLLRIIGILSQAFTAHSVVLFDEIENGVNQQLVELLMDFLLEISKQRQVFVTTHSPLILNYLPGEEARRGVIFLYKDRRGATHAKHFFELEQVAWKLNALGPGEAFVDTDLTDLAKKLAIAEGGNS